MTFKDSVMTCLKNKYCDFNGRASRSEYWYFVLFQFIVSLILACLPRVLSILTLALFLPGLGVSVRRMHDVGKSGWVLLLGFIPLVNLILLYWAVLPGQEGSNKYGE